MFGILFSFAVGMMRTCGCFNINNFFEQGEVYEFSPEILTKSTTSWQYDPISATYVIVNENAKKNLPVINTYKSWKYISLNVCNMNRESSEIIFAFYDKLGNKVCQQANTIMNGDNLILIQYPAEFQKIKMIVKNQLGLIITINSMQLKDTDVGFSGSVFLKAFSISFAIYIVVSLLVTALLDIKLKDRDWYAWVEVLQYAYILFGDCLGSWLTKKLDKKTKNRIRKELFWFLFTNTIIYQILGLYMNQDFYKYGILFIVLALIIVALLSWEKPLQYVKWNGPLQGTWLILWTGVCISDFVVSKYFKFIGYAFLVGVGFFFFVWNNMEKPKQIRNDMIRGLEWTFPVVLIYCMFFRQKIDGIFYNGIFHERQDMALYVLMMFIVFLSEMFYYMVHSHSNSREKWIILYGVGAVVSSYFLWQTGVRICLVASIVGLILFLHMLQKERRTYKKSVFAIMAVCSVLAVLVIHNSVINLPRVLQTNIVYEKDCFDTIYEELSSEELEEKVLEHTRSVTEVHKKAIWKNYIKKMNFFGNENRLLLYGKRTMAYNGFLEMAYRYGIFILIPYIVLLIICFCRAVQEGGYLMMATTLTFGIVMLTQNIEQPFAHPLWIVFYLGMGIWFTEEGHQGNGRKMEKLRRLINKKGQKYEEKDSKCCSGLYGVAGIRWHRICNRADSRTETRRNH